jgi:hypothetical protein
MARESRKAEADVQEDPHQAHTRAEGGVENPEHPDQDSTTGTTPSGSFVGRIAGEDVGYEGETGAERRAKAAKQSERADRESEDSFPASDPPADY